MNGPSQLPQPSLLPRRESARRRPRAEQRRATVAFVDLLGFTALSQSVGPERAYHVVTGCLRLLDEIARRHGGAVDKYLGDSLMAVFGYPAPLADAPLAAVRAALEMRERVREYDAESGLGGALDLHVGVNTGPLVAGDIRGAVVREFHVLGDSVNVAARLKAKAPAGAILVGPETFEATREGVEYRALEPLRLKGKSAPVAAFAALAAREAACVPGIDVHVGSDAALVGRHAELGVLRERIARLASGAGGLVAIEGDPGSGKSRLLAEIAAEPALVERISVFSLRSTPGLGAEPPWCAQLEAACDGPLPEAPEPSSREDALAAMLRRAGEARPLLLVCEDVQRWEPASLAMLEALTQRLPAAPVLFVVTGPPGAPAVARLAEHLEQGPAEAVERIRLGRLTAREAQRLVAGVLPEGEVPLATRELVEARGAGNPGRLLMAAFLAPALASEQEAAAAREERTAEAERRRATILFADITGFTAMTERIGAGEAYPIVADCLALLDEVARRHGGTVDHYLGDCVMALFGVPKSIEDAPRAAVNAAIEMRQRLAAYNRDHELEHRLDVHTGIHTGVGIAGDISGPMIREFAVMGDPVVVASELTDLAPAGRIYVGSETHRFTRDVFEFRALDAVTLGHAGRVQPFEVVSSDLHLYRARLGAERKVFSAIVGRDEELAALRRCVAGLHEGRGGIVSVVAEAGLGKSRIVAELAASPEARETTWLEGRSISTGQQLSFHPFADLCRSWAGIDDDDASEQAREKLRQRVVDLLPGEGHETFPFIATLLGMPLEEADRERLARIPADAMERLIRRAVTDLLRQGSLARPHVVVMDDLHWADFSSVELLESLLRLVEGLPILFVDVSRPGFPATSQRIRAHAAAHHADRHLEIHLEPLGPDAARTMVKNLFPDGGIPHATRNTIETRAQGNPFYIEEVVRSLLDQGAVVYEDGHFRATDRIHSVEIPGTVQEVVMARVDGLPSAKRTLLQTAAVIGRSFHQAVLEGVAGETGKVDALLEDLVASEFLVPWDRSLGVEYAFKHPLIQEVVYDGLLEARRQELHRVVARAIEQQLPRELPGFDGMLAYHFSLGRDVEHAETYLFKAGDEAAKLAASNEALHFFREASKLYLEIHGERADPEKRALLEKNIARALHNKGQLIEAIEHLNRALALLGEPVSPSKLRDRARFVRNLVTGVAGAYVPRLRRTRPRATPRQGEVIDLMYQRAQAQVTAADSMRYVMDSMEILRQLKRVDAATVPRAVELYAAAGALFSYGGISLAVGQRFLDLARPLVDAGDVGQAMPFATMQYLHHVLAGDWGEENEIDEALLGEALQYGQIYNAIVARSLSAHKHVAKGAFAVAAVQIEQLAKLLDLYQHDLAASNLHYATTLLALERRRLDEALHAAEVYYDEHPEDLLNVLALGLKGKAQVLSGAIDDAARTLARSAAIVARLGRQSVPPYQLSRHLQGQLLLDVTRLEEAVASGDARARRRAGAAALRTASLANSVAGRIASSRTEAYRLTGLAHWLLGRRARAERWWRKSLDEATRIGARPELGRTHLEIGRRAVEAGRANESLAGSSAEQHLAAAGRIFDELELAWDAARLAAVKRDER